MRSVGLGVAHGDH